MSKNLVIVESPAKARTISRYLGDDFVVESSVGHIRDIPSRASEVPESKKAAWKATRFGVDVDHDFAPLYIVTPDSKQQVAGRYLIGGDERREAAQGTEGSRLPLSGHG